MKEIRLHGHGMHDVVIMAGQVVNYRCPEEREHTVRGVDQHHSWRRIRRGQEAASERDASYNAYA
ncbi:MAG: hypothetical protein Q8P59_01850 [Dehalococcoidia bacterium]|nr:hypothetical protein [Dehalococcoidia bacterium]